MHVRALEAMILESQAAMSSNVPKTTSMPSNVPKATQKAQSCHAGRYGWQEGRHGPKGSPGGVRTSVVETAKKTRSNSSAPSTKLPNRFGSTLSPGHPTSTSQRLGGTCMGWRRAAKRASLKLKSTNVCTPKLPCVAPAGLTACCPRHSLCSSGIALERCSSMPSCRFSSGTAEAACTECVVPHQA